jgi:hypothetical protein
MQLAVLNNVELRSMLLEERKAAPQYKALFEAEPVAMEVDNKHKDGKDAKQDPVIDDDDYVDVKPVEGLTQKLRDGAASAAAAAAAGPETAAAAAVVPATEAVTFKVVPEYKEVAAGPTTVKV